VATGDADDADDGAPLPWHLKLLGVSFCLYMAWRLYQLAEWLFHRF